MHRSTNRAQLDHREEVMGSFKATEESPDIEKTERYASGRFDDEQQEKELPAGALTGGPAALPSEEAGQLPPAASAGNGYIEPGVRGWLCLAGVFGINALVCEFLLCPRGGH